MLTFYSCLKNRLDFLILSGNFRNSPNLLRKLCSISRIFSILFSFTSPDVALKELLKYFLRKCSIHLSFWGSFNALEAC